MRRNYYVLSSYRVYVIPQASPRPSDCDCHHPRLLYYITRPRVTRANSLHYYPVYTYPLYTLPYPLYPLHSVDSEKQRMLPIGGPGEYFDLQCGRRALAEVVGADAQGVNWRDCVLGYDGEVKDAETFKDRLKPFDFTMDDEA